MTHKSSHQDRPLIGLNLIRSIHGVPGMNGGQVVKDFAASNGINTNALDNRTPSCQVHVQKKQMPGGEISIPVTPTTTDIQEEWLAKIESGMFLVSPALRTFLPGMFLQRWLLKRLRYMTTKLPYKK